MSGPKVSIYRVESYIRKNIQQQQRLKRQCVSLCGRIHDRLSDLEAVLEKCGAFLKEQESMGGKAEGTARCRELAETVRKERDGLRKRLRAAGPVGKVPVKYRYSPETVEQDTEKVRVLGEILDGGEKAAAGLQKQAVALLDEYRIDYARVSEQAKDALGKAGTFDFREIALRKRRNDWSRRDGAVAKLKEYTADGDLSPELRERAGEAVRKLLEAEDDRTADNYIVVVVSGIRRDAERERNRRAEEIAEYKARIRDYHAVCEETGAVPREIPLSENWREELGEAMAETVAATDRADEKKYISDCLDTVMAEMGYKVIGYRDVTKKSGKTFHSSLYSYADGRAIHVTQTGDGQITMELGGLDHCDRLPESREAEALEEDMYSFCDSFAEIEQRLRRKGVVMADRIAKPVPSQEYATIINLDDFIMTGGQEIETIAVGDIGEAAGQKEMHVE